MPKLNRIKQAILALNQGAFQNLCDEYLLKSGYCSLNAYGMKPGTDKTTFGTPDTYFITQQGKYVFVEYTTQQGNIETKIKSDIDKCLDVDNTRVPYEQIAEIIYCHTTSNVSPGFDREMKAVCADKGIILTIIGIDKMASELSLYYHGIVKNHLNITIDSDQILEQEEFIKRMDANDIAPPLSTCFIGREKEQEEIGKAYEDVSVVILTGAAGVGKTRLALHYAKTYAYKTQSKLYCIRDNGLPIREDILLRFNKQDKYMVMIDDANHLSQLKYVIRTLNELSHQKNNIKVLITVRDYALSNVEHDVREIVRYQKIKINPMTDEQIKNLVIETLGILNGRYLERIAHIAEGNARIAMLAGKISSETNRLDSISNAAQLYESYYGTVIEDAGMLENKHLVITAGIIAFLNVIHIEHIQPLSPVLLSTGISSEELIDNLYLLHDKEIVDIWNDKAVRFSEQCLSNFFLKYVFLDKKFISVAAMVEACFVPYRNRTVMAISTLLNLFCDEGLQSYISREIKQLWRKLSEANDPNFFAFVKAFYKLNSTEALLIVQQKIEQEGIVRLSADDIDVESGRNCTSIDNGILEILGGYADTNELDAALELFFHYYTRRPDLFMRFFHAASTYYGINKDSHRFDYHTQICFFQKLGMFSQDWSEEAVNTLFIELASEFLKLWFLPHEGGRRNTITIYQVPLVPSNGVFQYRKIIWDCLMVLADKQAYRGRIYEILKLYGGKIDNESIPIAKSDILYIEAMMMRSFPPDKLNNCILADKIVTVFRKLSVNCDDLFANYLTSDEMRMYRLLIGPEYDGTLAFSEREIVKKTAIRERVSCCTIDEFKSIIRVCADLIGIDGHAEWQVSRGLEMVFKEFALRHSTDDCMEAVKCYFENNTPFNINPSSIMAKLFANVSAEEVWLLINSFVYTEKNYWQYIYYHELPPNLINQVEVCGLYRFLEDKSDAEIKKSAYRGIDFLDKYNAIDPNAFINCCKIILTKVEYSPFISHIYFGLLFNEHHNSPQSVIIKFRNDIDLLENIYIKMLAYDKSEDYDGLFLKAIYEASPSILNKYIGFINDNAAGDWQHDGIERDRVFFTLDDEMDSIRVIDKIVESVNETSLYPEIPVTAYIKALLMPSQCSEILLQRQDSWIRHYIADFCKDMQKMECLFSAISELDVERRQEYVCLFITINPDYMAFERIPLTPTSYSWSGSGIPMYESWIEYLRTLLPCLVGLKYIEHKNRVLNLIDHVSEMIRNEEIDEVLRG